MTKNISLLIKRCFDFLGSGFGLLITSPILFLSAILIKLTMPGPVFFFQERLGYEGNCFKIYKFRTMRVDAVAENAHNAKGDQQRITKLGFVLRRLKIDELPQLINVLKGDMSFVGPRPSFPEHLSLYNDREKGRLEIRPGMTGLAQVNGNGALCWEDRIEYDLKYIDSFSILLDIKILIKTIRVVIEGEEKFVNKLSNTNESKFVY